MTDHVMRTLRGPLGLLPAVGFLIVFFAAPFVALVYFSLLEMDRGNVVAGPSLDGYVRLMTDPFTYFLFGRTIGLSMAVTALCLLFGFPVAYLYTRVRSKLWKVVILGVVITPLLTSSLVLSFGWIVILGRRGLLNELLIDSGLIAEPMSLLFTLQGVFIGMVQVHLPFMIVPLIASLQSMSRDLEESAADLGATKWQIFWRITIPQSVPGIAAGASLAFILAYTAFTVPTLMGGASMQIVSVYIWNNVRLLAWDTAAAYSTALLLTSLALIVGFNVIMRRLAPWQHVRT